MKQNPINVFWMDNLPYDNTKPDYSKYLEQWVNNFNFLWPSHLWPFPAIWSRFEPTNSWLQGSSNRCHWLRETIWDLGNFGLFVYFLPTELRLKSQQSYLKFELDTLDWRAKALTTELKIWRSFLPSARTPMGTARPRWAWLCPPATNFWPASANLSSASSGLTCPSWRPSLGTSCRPDRCRWWTVGEVWK